MNNVDYSIRNKLTYEPRKKSQFVNLTDTVTSTYFVQNSYNGKKSRF